MRPPRRATRPPRAARGPDGPAERERCFWAALEVVRARLEQERDVTQALAARLRAAASVWTRAPARPVRGAPARGGASTRPPRATAASIPDELRLAPGSSTTIRGALGDALATSTRHRGGAVLTASADLYGSTSVSAVAADFPPGFFNAATNPEARLLSVGGICEDAIAGVLSGISTFGHAVGVGSSYGAFMAPLGHIAARLHCIGAQARQAVTRRAVQADGPRSAPTPGSRPARTAPRTPTRRRCSSSRRTSPAARRSR